MLKDDSDFSRLMGYRLQRVISGRCDVPLSDTVLADQVDSDEDTHFNGFEPNEVLLLSSYVNLYDAPLCCLDRVQNVLVEFYGTQCYLALTGRRRCKRFGRRYNC